MINVVDFDKFKEEKADKDSEKDEVSKVLSQPMQSLYVTMYRQAMSDSMDGLFWHFDSMAELGLTKETAAELMDALADELQDAAMAAEYIADIIRGEDE